MNNIVFGKYLPLDTFIHKIDPRSKIIGLFVLLVSVFISKNPYSLLVIGIVNITICLISKISFKTIIKTLKPICFMMVFLLVVNCLSLKTGTLLFTIFNIPIYSDGIFNTLLTVIRLVLMILITTVLTATTKPLDLTLGLESIFKPLMLIKFPVHEMSMMISIALRFIPTIIEETFRIMNAQKSRGVDFEEGKLSEKIQAILSLIVPLFSVAFQRAYELADAMEARGYVPDKQRTRYKELEFSYRDLIYIFVIVVVLGFAIYSRGLYAL